MARKYVTVNVLIAARIKAKYNDHPCRKKNHALNGVFFFTVNFFPSTISTSRSNSFT